MTKAEALDHIRALYVALNTADSDSPNRADWMTPAMAGSAGCRKLDEILNAWVSEGALTTKEHQAFLDTF